MWASQLDPNEWTFEIPPAWRDRLWNESQTQGNATGCWTAYLNRLCLAVFDRLWDEMGMADKPQVWPSLKSLPAIWEVTTGTALTLAKQRLVIIPTEAVDASELSVPQEWVDIPQWVGDYYISAQIDPPAEHLQILGYITHKQLKAQGEYDAFDRTYCIDTDELIAWDAFQPSYRHYSTSQTRVTIPTLSSPEPAQAEQLISRLGSPQLVMPRLALPFEQWAALLESESWREQLYQQRLGNDTPQDWSQSITKLSAWLQGQVEQGWQGLEMLRSREAAPAMRSPSSAQPFTLGKQLMEENPVLLAVSITPLEADQFSVSLKLDPATKTSQTPLSIRLLDGMGEQLTAEQAQTPLEMIQLQFIATLGERFDLEISLGNEQITERFEL